MSSLIVPLVVTDRRWPFGGHSVVGFADASISGAVMSLIVSDSSGSNANEIARVLPGVALPEMVEASPKASTESRGAVTSMASKTSIV
jgi:hypothetical protein